MDTNFRILTSVVVAIIAIVVMVVIQKSVGTKNNAFVGLVGTIAVFVAWGLTGKRR
jgi:hypothetical protein